MNKIEPEYKDAFETWKSSPSPDTTDRLLSTIKPVIDSGLTAFGSSSSSSPTMRSRAKSLAIDSFAQYDPAKGTLRSHVLSRLQRLRRISGQEQQVLRMPERVALQRKRLEETGLQLEDTLGRPPSDEELADNLGLSMNRLEHIRLGVRPMAESTLAANVEDPGFTPQVKNVNQDSWVEFVHSDMAPRDQAIMERVMGLHGFKPQSVTSVAKHLKVSPAAVSQRLAVIQEQLDKRDELKVL